MDTMTNLLKQIWQRSQEVGGNAAPWILIGVGVIILALLVTLMVRMRFFRYNWESLKSIKRNGWMTFAATTSVTITLILLGLFASVMLNVEKVTRDIEGNVPILVRLSEGSTDAQKTIKNDKGETVTNKNYHKVYDQIMAFDQVKSITYSSKEAQLEKYKATLGDDWESSPLLDVYEVKLTSSDSLKSLSAKIQDLEEVDSVDFGGADIERLTTVTNYIRIGGLAGTGILLLIAIFIISNTIRITIMARQNEIQIMRLVGAKNSYIKGPFFFEGAWIGLIGTIVPALLMFFIYTWVYQGMNPSFQEDNLSLYAPSFFIPAMIVAMAAVGMVIGALGSVLSMRRFLKV